MWQLLTKIKDKLPLSILIAMLAGLFIGYFIDTSILNNLVIPLTILMVFPMMVNMDFKQLLHKGDNKLIVLAQLVNFIAIPLIAFGIGLVFFKDQPFVFIGLMIMAVLPTSGMSISWTGFAKGNITAAVKIVISGLILGAFLGPLILKLAFGTSVTIPALKIIKQILIVILIPMIIGVVTKKLMLTKISQNQYNQKWKKRFPTLSSIGVILVIFIATSLKAKTIINDPMTVVLLIAPIIIFYMINFFITTVIGNYFCKENNRTALVYGTVMRNLSVALAIAMTAFDAGKSDIALIIAISYIFQVQFASLYTHLYQKITNKQQLSEKASIQNV